LEKLEKCGTVLTVVWRLGYDYSYDPVYFISDLDGNPILFYIYNVDLRCCYVDNLDLLFETYYIELHVDNKFYLLEIDDVDILNEIDVYLGVSG